MTFTAITEAQWQPIQSTHNWPEGNDWRGGIDQIGRDYWEAEATRKKWVDSLQGKKPAKQREKVHRAWMSTRRMQKELTELADDSLLYNDFVLPDLESLENRLEAWLSDYDLWVGSFAGKSNPIQAELEWRLLDLWRRSGGKLAYSRMKEKGPSSRRVRTGRGAAALDDRQDHADAERPNTPYAPLLDFLRLTLSAILGKTYRPSGVAKIIDRHRSERSGGNPWLTYAMTVRISGTV